MPPKFMTKSSPLTEPMDSLAAATTTAKPAVLLIDDEPFILDVMRAGLQSEFEIETASSAEEADVMIGTRHYAAIVCDQILPGENGLEFLIRAFRQQPTARRILLTGYINPELLSRSTSLAGLSACLLKPVHFVELKKAINSAIAAK
jgi:two-component system response regulator HupR/HoxA